MSDDASTLTPAQLRAVEALAGGATWTKAAEAAGVTDRQLRRWRLRDTFAQALRQQTAALFDEGLRVLAAGLRDAAEYLGDAAAGRTVADPARTTAARAILQLAPGLREHVELEERLRVLEASAAAGAQAAAS